MSSRMQCQRLHRHTTPNSMRCKHSALYLSCIMRQRLATKTYLSFLRKLNIFSLYFLHNERAQRKSKGAVICLVIVPGWRRSLMPLQFLVVEIGSYTTQPSRGGGGGHMLINTLLFFWFTMTHLKINKQSTKRDQGARFKA